MTISSEEFDAAMRAKGWVKSESGWISPLRVLGAGGGVESRHAEKDQPRLGPSGLIRDGNTQETAAAADMKGKQPSGSSAPPARTLKRIRQSSKPLLNKLETEWYHILKSTYPEDCPVFAQAMRFRLGNGIWYKPDFIVWGAHVYAYEVKGKHAFRGGFENLKVAASIYKQIKWYLVWKENGRWQEQEILP